MGERRIQAAAAAVLASALLNVAAHAAPAAEVESARGVVMVQGAAGEAPRIGAKGVQLEPGDRVTTADGAIALLRFVDGTRMTVRPNSELVVAQYQFTARDDPGNNMLLQLLRGGLRTVTGFISKGSPNAARIQTNTATIGIRGTDFDARVCDRDCAAEAAREPESTHPNSVRASARVVEVEGDARVADNTGHVRRLIRGTSIYPGELLESSAGATVALAFRDGTRMTVAPVTRMRIDDFVYDDANAAEGRFLMSLLRGTLRVVGGTVATAQPQNALVNTRSGTVTLRGGGLDIRCSGECAAEPAGAGLEVFAWLGDAAVAAGTPTQTQVLQAGQGVALNGGAARTIASIAGVEGARPDALQVPPELFAREQVGDDEPGLFVHVRDGHIEIAQGGHSLHLGRGETG